MEEEVKIKLREELERLTSLLQAIETLADSEEWQVLVELQFGKLVERIKTQMLGEAQAQEINPVNLYRLQGELKWARKYADLKGYAETLKRELENIKRKLKE